MNTGIEIDAKAGSVKNIPAPLLGWAVVAAIAVFLVWNVVGSLNTKMDTMVRNGDKQNATLEKILEAVKK